MSYDEHLYFSSAPSEPDEDRVIYNHSPAYITFEDYDPLFTGCYDFNPTGADAHAPLEIPFFDPALSASGIQWHDMHPYAQKDFTSPQTSIPSPVPIKLEGATVYSSSDHSRQSSSESACSPQIQSGQNHQTPSEKKEAKKQRRRQQNRRAQQAYRQRNHEYLLRVKKELEEKTSELTKAQTYLEKLKQENSQLRKGNPQMKQESKIKQEP
jgi:hypothetical protein